MNVSGIWRINILLTVLFVIVLALSLAVLLKTTGKIPAANRNEVLYSAIPDVVPARRSISISDFDEIASKNAMSPDRKYTPDEKIIVEPEKKDEVQTLPDKDLILYGTLIAGEAGFAIISNPGIDGNDHPQVKVRKGDRPGIYLIKEINALSITVQKGGQDYVIPINKSKTSEVSQKTSHDRSTDHKSRIRKIGSEPSSADEQARRDTVEANKKPNGDKAKRDELKDNNPAKQAVRISENAPKSDEANPSPSGTEEKYEMINTPFGPVKRKVK